MPCDLGPIVRQLSSTLKRCGARSNEEECITFRASSFWTWLIRLSCYFHMQMNETSCQGLCLVSVWDDPAASGRSYRWFTQRAKQWKAITVQVEWLFPTNETDIPVLTTDQDIYNTSYLVPNSLPLYLLLMMFLIFHPLNNAV